MRSPNNVPRLTSVLRGHWARFFRLNSVRVGMAMAASIGAGCALWSALSPSTRYGPLVVVAIAIVVSIVPNVVIAAHCGAQVGADDIRLGTQKENHLAGIPRSFAVLAQLSLVLVAVLALPLATALAAAIVALGDATVRTALGGDVAVRAGLLPWRALTGGFACISFSALASCLLADVLRSKIAGLGLWLGTLLISMGTQWVARHGEPFALLAKLLPFGSYLELVLGEFNPFPVAAVRSLSFATAEVGIWIVILVVLMTVASLRRDLDA